MKEEIMKRLEAAMRALNTVSVCGKANLANLSGSIAVLEEAYAMVSQAAIIPEGEAAGPGDKEE